MADEIEIIDSVLESGVVQESSQPEIEGPTDIVEDAVPESIEIAGIECEEVLVERRG